MISILEQRSFPVGKLFPLASERSAGSTINFKGKSIRVTRLDEFDFSTIEVGFFSAGGSVSAIFAPKAVSSGCVVVDNTSYFRNDPEIPLVVPEVNAHAIDGHDGIIANPNCSTIQMVVALKPLHEAAGIKRVVVSTYQSVSGSGKDAMDELFNQTKGIYMNQEAKPSVYPKQIAFNVIPQIDMFMDDGMTKEEWKMVAETKKILDPKIKVCANCVRVPVFIGHSEMVNVEFERELSAKDAKKIWREADGVTVIDLDQEDLEYVTPHEIQGEDNVYVSRIREDVSVENGLNFWCVADNLRKGAALNTVQIAELLIKDTLKG